MEWGPVSHRWLAVLALCGAGFAQAETFVRSEIVTDPTPGRFSVCHGGTCTIVSQVALDDERWSRVAAAFVPAPKDAADERARIAEAIGRLETVVGALTGTADDRAENQLGDSWSGQMDCIDESTNTTTYLRMLAQSGLMRWHRVEDRVTRGWFLFGWPHTTAVVSEVKSGALWAVDSWFFENGRPPAVVPLESWKAGWRPAKTPLNASP